MLPIVLQSGRERLAEYVARSSPAGDRRRRLFVTAIGQPLHHSSVGAMWRTACREVGAEGVRFHDLRHHAAASLIAGGADVILVQRVLGQASAKVALDVYGHLRPEADDRVRAVMSQVADEVCNRGVTVAVGTASELR